MRVALFAFVLAVSGCAKKQPPAQAPAPPMENKPADSAASPGEAGAPAPDDATKDQGTVKGDPCDGGEVKKK